MYLFLFFFHCPATTDIYTLSLHDALPIYMETMAADGTARPAAGTLTAFDPPSGPGIRVDSLDRKSTRLNSSHLGISYAVFCLKKKKNDNNKQTYTTVINIEHL